MDGSLNRPEVQNLSSCALCEYFYFTFYFAHIVNYHTFATLQQELPALSIKRIDTLKIKLKRKYVAPFIIWTHTG